MPIDAIQPPNYTAQFASIPHASTALMSGIGMAEDLQNMSRKNQEELQKQAAQAQMQADLTDFYGDPSMQKVQAMMAKYPQFSDKWKPLLENITEEKRNNLLQQVSAIRSLATSGDYEGAAKHLLIQRDARKNSGDEAGAAAMGRIAQLFTDPGPGDTGKKAATAGLIDLEAGLGGAAHVASINKSLSESAAAAEMAPTEKAYKEALTAKALRENGPEPHLGSYVGPSGPGVFTIDKQTREVKQIPGLTPMPSAMSLVMGADSKLTPEAKQMLVDKYITTGALDADLSARNPGLRTEIINAAAEKLGTTPDLAAAKADYKSNMTSLVNMQKQRDQMVTFEKTALKNLDQFLELAKKMPGSGSKWLNTPIRELASGAFGSEAQAAAKTALMVVRPEFAKINQGALTGVLSDSARKEVEAAMPDNSTLGQFIAVSKVLKQDAANRHEFYDKALAEIKGRLKGKKSEPEPEPKAPIVVEW